ncbi:MAG: efflux RND transporter permease subunit [Pseudomonadota bacterium]|nr:efflux RND transporter permease subunit [Pseudomonadota bacterium]
MKSLIRFFAQRSTLSNVLTFLIVFLGLSSMTVIQRDNFPSVDFLEMTVTTRYPGASPEDVELNVTNKIEEELKEVDGLDKYTSFSMENISVVHIWIDREAGDSDKVKTDVRDAVSRVSGFPREVDEKPVVEELTTSTAIPIVEVGLTGDVPYTTLRTIAKRAEKALLDVPGVASVAKFGFLDREIKVEVNRDAVERYRIPVHDVVAAIRNRNIRATGGSFESYTSEKNIVTLSEFSDPEEAGEVIIKLTGGGATVRVRDLASVSDGFEPAKILSRMNGKPAISFLVFKKESADIMRTVEGIKKLVDENRERLPEGVRIEYSNDKSRLVRNRLEVVAWNGVMGLILVTLVLTVFLDLRSAFWVAFSIPVVLLGTLFLLPIFGAYLDSIALASMIIVIGIIVDDGIVIAENIWRHREEGMPPIDAAVEGTYSVFQPVLTTILTTALAFMPMFFMSGTMGDFVYVIPLVVVLALAISWFDVMFIMPAHLIAGAGEVGGMVEGQREHWFAQVRGVYGRFLNVALKMRYLVVVVFLALLVIAFWYAGRYMDFVLFPTQSADEFYILAELPSGSSLEHTEEKLAEVEAIVQALPAGELDSMVTRVGTHGQFNLGENENWAMVGVYLTPFATRNRNADEIVEALRARAADLEGFVGLKFIIDSGGPPVGRPVTLRVVGSDDEKRSDLADLLTQRLEDMPGVKDVDRDDKTGKQEIRINLDYTRLADQGISVADVARNIRLSYDGEIVTSVRYGDEDVDFRVQLDEQARRSAEGLGEMIVPTPEDRLVYLSEVATFSVQPGPSNFYHFDNDRTITVTADVVKTVTTPLKVTTDVMRGIEMDRDWEGMRVVVGGEAEETQDSMASLFVAFLAAAVGIYLILLLLFNSAVQPILVMFAVPFGLVGVIFAFAVHLQPLGFLAMLGVVGLTGIVVNDSLILVNLLNRLRRQRPGEPLKQLIIEAASNRLRPILLTSVTTVAGLLPMAYGLGGSDPFSAPMALAMGYGILFATPLTLLLLPCLLVLHEDVSARAARLWAALHW